MFDLNTILTAALTAAVTEATKPLLERIEKLETNCNAYEILFKSHIERFEALETDADVKALETSTLSPDDLVQVKQRIEALENIAAEYSPTASIDEARLIEVLDKQEWFWEKLMRKAGEAAEAAAEEAINDHCTTYDHDDYDRVSSAVNEVDLDEIVTIDNLRDEIKDVLSKASVSIDV